MSSSSFTSSSYSSSSPTNPQGSTTRYTEQAHSNSRDGTTVRRTHEETGRPTLDETRHYPHSSSGRVEGENVRRIEDVTGTEEDDGRDDRDQATEQAKRDHEYEERMEDEYAKREGGA
ncbi:uncharacterized protein A1O9_03723 [Exophiala aquamarina CBS 119918]|uniref:Uncharacterized protein n=1 Tax=Exophiala aquamarina CBS 119918 TaxID=1182545 RepID=A0A072PTP1_9EURO|nr:uncharacterized protein A1O9_03723 [Exophiala aquamarina CBS 119918]KEF58880.1 hypothetical protein A1O9_03723 [Exophiala aquamarina CBS 119918]